MARYLFASAEVDRLFEVISTLEGREEFYCFFDDLCTISEIQSMAQRFAVAELLAHGCTYNEIVEKTGCATATISRVTRTYNYGSGGYKLAMEKHNG